MFQKCHGNVWIICVSKAQGYWEKNAGEVLRVTGLGESSSKGIVRPQGNSEGFLVVKIFASVLYVHYHPNLITPFVICHFPAAFCRIEVPLVTRFSQRARELQTCFQVCSPLYMTPAYIVVNKGFRTVVESVILMVKTAWKKGKYWRYAVGQSGVGPEFQLLRVTRHAWLSPDTFDINWHDLPIRKFLQRSPALRMREIHDQFDTILIFDFGSQVCIRFFPLCGFYSNVISVVQPFDNKKM